MTSRRIPVSVAVFLLALTWAGWAVQRHVLEERTRSVLVTRADQLSSAYENDVAAKLSFINAVLNFVASFDAANGPDGAADAVAINRLYTGMNANLVVAGTDGNGTFVGPSGRGGIFIGDRPHFRRVLASHDNRLVIGLPLTARVKGGIAVPFARAVRTPNGRLIGVVATAVPARTFSAAFDLSDIGAHGALGLIDIESRTLLSRYTVARETGGSRTVGPRITRDLGEVAHDTFFQQSILDGTERAYAYRKVRGFKVAVVAALALADAVPGEAAERRTMLIASVAISAFILIGLAAWLRQVVVAKRLADLNHEAEAARVEAVAASRAKSEFLANMSHEIRTPMNGVIGLTYLALNTQLTAQQRDYLTKIHASASSLLGVINDVLDISRIESGKVELEHVPFEIDHVLDNVATIASVQAAQNDVRFEVVRDAAVPRSVVGDTLRVGQILTNLVGNALKFTERGSVRLTVDVVASDADRLTLRFVVRDTGIGMTPEAVARLFQPFGQVDASITRRFGGTGLGLAISKGFVDRMGGSISVESAAGVGSAFTVDLPFERAPATSTQPARVPTATNRQLAGLRVLVAEDNSINQEIIVGLLGMAGATVECVANGQLAVRRVLDGPPLDCVLMDVQMPVLDGLSATRRIRERYDAATLPIIAMTAHVLDEERRRCIDAGMNDHVAKPIVPATLVATLSRNRRGAAIVPNLPSTDDAHVVGAAANPSALQAALPEFALADALARAHGDEAFLRRMFARFVEAHTGAAGTLRAALARGDTSAALQLAHALAGVAGNIGAATVARDARELEHRLGDGDPGTDALDALTISLRDAIGRLAALEPAAPVGTETSAVDPPDVKAGLDALALLINSNNLRARKLFAGLRPAFDHTPLAPRVAVLAAQLERLDFVPARQTLSEIVAHLG